MGSVRQVVFILATFCFNMKVGEDSIVSFTTSVFVQSVAGVCTEAIFVDKINWEVDNEALTGGTMTVELAARKRFDTTSMVAQADSGMLVPPSRSANVEANTMGEYTTSLRALTRRFSQVFFMPQNSVRSYTPHMTQNDQTDGHRTVGLTVETKIPDSHYSLVSYLYRFYVGGARLKVFNRALTGHTMCSLAFSRERSLTSPVRDPTPVVEQSAIINNCMEVTIPYYGQTRCYVLAADQVDSKPLPHAVISPIGEATSSVNVYEAGSDDLTFFFLIGPPVMHSAWTETLDTPIIP